MSAKVYKSWLKSQSYLEILDFSNKYSRNVDNSDPEPDEEYYYIIITPVQLKELYHYDIEGI